ncbi:hypothetical protein [Auritidibacter ignavus]|uniref:hypothetical protein n=1 Tax=Auritidibacter ignavus TaxID=678932 RepID=UPI0011C3E967|nr:hypothetical protein [Auritidibacter ignavus]NIH70807.1 hypothetical protein [Auritidibacter ignavus]WGH81976.1 hypothetical protein QDX25_02045 [Auritidibacter ignavus]WGH86585.1 hypothetical protein QDX24_01860 [Auritidibacter ignavus]WGH88871.1 hypothetical protein QDX22_01860 [Auritidibacter ignavus]WGH91174.1 hypothetical protein QDX23_02005 [Auritidibacter ignavus]
MISHGLLLFSRGAVLIAGLAPPDPPNSGEARARCPLCFGAGKVVRAVAFSLLGEGRGDLRTHSCGFFLGPTEHGGVLVILGPVRGALGVKPVRGLLPPLRRLLCTLCLTIEPGEFFRNALDRAVPDDAADRRCRLYGGVVEAAVGGVALHRCDELRTPIRHVLGDDMQRSSPG